jgi:hypothetical protein
VTTARAQWRWWTFAVGIVGGFAYLESVAYRHGTYPTLTVVLRYWLGIDPVKERRTIRAAIAAGAVAGGLVTLGVHLARVPEIEEHR